jgi:hypothetical protein
MPSTTDHRRRNQFGGLKAEDAKKKDALREIARDAPIDVKC